MVTGTRWGKEFHALVETLREDSEGRLVATLSLCDPFGNWRSGQMFDFYVTELEVQGQKKFSK